MEYFATLFLRSLLIVLAATLSILSVSPVYADEVKKGADSAQIMRDFNQQRVDTERAKSITDKDKQRIMFLLGIVLIVLILITGGLGIAMGVFGKPVFVPHMIFAGLSTTLAIVHAIVGIVWFYPF
jgi:cytochrome b subunit of formate dehydrogenase